MRTDVNDPLKCPACEQALSRTPGTRPCVHFYRRCSIAFTEMVFAIAKFYMGRDAKQAKKVDEN